MALNKTNFSEAAQHSILLAVQEAKDLESDCVDAEHLLLGLVGSDNTCTRVLQKLDISPDQVRFEVLVRIHSQAKAVNEPRLTAKAKRVLELAAKEARQMRHDHVGTEHLLLALLRLKSDKGLMELDLYHIPMLILHGLGFVPEEAVQAREQARQEGLFPFGSKVAIQVLDQLDLDFESTRIVLADYLGIASKDSIWTEQAQRIINQSHKEARATGSGRIDSGHLLLALMRGRENTATLVLDQALRAKGTSLEIIQHKLKAQLCSDNELAGSTLKFTPRAKRVFKLAMAEARRVRHKYVGPEHLLLGLLPHNKKIDVAKLLQVGDITAQDDPVTRILGEVGLNVHDMRLQIMQALNYRQ